MIRRFLTLGISLIVSTGAAWADDRSTLLGQSFIYHPALLEEMGPGLKREVHVRAAADDRRSYLLDIGEEEFSAKPRASVRDVWDRIRNGFELPPLRGGLVADRELWYAQRKELVAGISQKARRYLYHIVAAVEKRGLEAVVRRIRDDKTSPSRHERVRSTI